MSDFSRLQLQRVAIIGEAPDTYHFTDGQQPPSFARVWYEDAADEVQPGFAVSLRAAGLLTQGQLSFSIEGQNDNLIAELTAGELADDPELVEMSVELQTDPRAHGEARAEQVAAETAQYLFTIATLQ